MFYLVLRLCAVLVGFVVLVLLVLCLVFLVALRLLLLFLFLFLLVLPFYTLDLFVKLALPPCLDGGVVDLRGAEASVF